MEVKNLCIQLDIDSPTVEGDNLNQILHNWLQKRTELDTEVQQRILLVSRYKQEYETLQSELHIQEYDSFISQNSLKLSWIDEFKQILNKLYEERESRMCELRQTIRSLEHNYLKCKDFLTDLILMKLEQINIDLLMIPPDPIEILQKPLSLSTDFLLELKHLNSSITNLYETKVNEVCQCISEIKLLWNDLQIGDEVELNEDPSFLEQYEIIRDGLRTQWSIKMKEKIDLYVTEIKDLWNKCMISEIQQQTFLDQIQDDIYSPRSESLILKELEQLKNCYKSCQEIFQLIQSRKELLQKMKEFESKASDPKRLFQPSFQLIEEEKFRKSCYPTLLKLENTIRDKIYDFEKDSNSIFSCDGEPYLNKLETDISNRFINESVFSLSCKLTPRKEISGLKARSPKTPRMKSL
ncbi:microtubule associated protein-domain-containing protein [Globomyces pollinis-pini]|nr:microtubule associated protein-domain-containing protein [Globomyces pollinis-pini]